MSNNFMKDFMGTQKNMMDSWKKMYESAATPSDNPYAKSMADFFEMQKKYIDAMKGKNPFEMQNIFMDYFKSPAFDPKSFEFFTNMQTMYMDQIQNFKPMTDAFQGNNPFFVDMTKYMDPSKWSGSMDTVNAYFQQMGDAFTPFKMGKVLDPAVKELYEKMFKANNYYLNLYNFWKELENTQIKPAANEMTNFVQDLMRRNNAMFNDMVVPMIPDEYQAYVKEPLELFKAYFAEAAKFNAPWVDNAEELRDLLVEGSMNDSSKLGEFFDLWRAQFDKTYGALLLSPTVGVSKHTIEQQNKAFDTFISLILLGIDFTSRMTAVQNENMGSIVEKYFEMTENGTQPKTFSEFYDYWSTQIEGVFESYFATTEYSQLIGRITTATMDYRIELNKLIEKYLIDSPIVMRTEMNSLYKTVYDLKKEVKSMKKAAAAAEKTESEKK